jgi:hypothetical protein
VENKRSPPENLGVKRQQSGCLGGDGFRSNYQQQLSSVIPVELPDSPETRPRTHTPASTDGKDVGSYGSDVMGEWLVPPF